MDNKEMSKQIRKKLKENGYSNRDVSVSVKDAGYSVAIHVKIKNPHIDKNVIELLIKQYERLDIDERTNEILEGANSYLFIDYEYGIFKEVAHDFAAEAMGLMKCNDEVIKVFDGLIFLNIDHGDRLELRQDNTKGHHSVVVNSFAHLCELLYKYSEFGTIAL